MPLYVFLIQETGTHHSSGSRGIPSRPDTFISVKEETEQTRVAVCSILPVGGGEREIGGGGKKKRKFFECAEGMRCLALNEKSAVEKIQRGNFTPAYEPGSEWEGCDDGRPPDAAPGDPSAARLTKGGMSLNWLWKKKTGDEYLGNQVLYAKECMSFFLGGGGTLINDLSR